jgi:hypothetical protein
MCTLCDSTNINRITEFVVKLAVVKAPTIISNSPAFYTVGTVRETASVRARKEKTTNKAPSSNHVLTPSQLQKNIRDFRSSQTMLLKVQLFCEVKLRHSERNYRRFEEPLCHHLQSPVIQKESDTRINHTHITHDIFQRGWTAGNSRRKHCGRSKRRELFAQRHSVPFHPLKENEYSKKKLSNKGNLAI